MVITTRRTAGKMKAITYKEQDSDDDVQMNDALPPPPELGESERPMKKLRTGIDSSSSIPPQQEDQVSESDGGYEASSSKKRKPRKGATAAKGKGKSKDKGKAKAQLHTLFDKLPTDVVYRIFSHLHPSDLLRLARTNRMLRSHLMSKSSASIWREAREDVDPPVPDCPPDQSEPQWACLLFSRDCSTCNRYNIPNVDWNLRLRLCSNCDHAGVVILYGPKAQKMYPHIPDVKMLIELLPQSNTGSCYRRKYKGKYYRMKDIEDIGAEWVSIKKKGSAAEIQEFKDRRKSETEEIMTHGAFCKAWDQDRSTLKREQNRDMKQARGDDLIARLEALGHDSRDVRDQRFTHSLHFNSSTPLTEQRWKNIRRGLEGLVFEAKASRHERERMEIVRPREYLAENLINAYYTTSNIPSAFRPRARVLFQTEPFRAIIEQPNDVTVIAADFQPALDALPDLVAAEAIAVQSMILQRMIDGGATNVGSPITPSDFGTIELATSTFSCNLRPDYFALPICGWEDMDSHRCSLYTPSDSSQNCLLYDHRASSAVAALIAVVNLQPTTTVDQMDQLDLRFHCPDLPGEWARLAMSWRDVACNAKQFTQPEPNSWQVLSPEDTITIKEKEKANRADLRRRYRCNHCSIPGLWRRELEGHLAVW